MKRMLISIVALLWMSSSYAVTECTTTILRVFTGDDGVVWMVFDAGFAGYVVGTDPDAKNVLASALTALVIDRTVTVRLAADSLPCNSTIGVRSDVTGMWIHK